MKFILRNQDALMFIYTGDKDYVAARCCIINGLSSGFVLASQAIEKNLKACICLESKDKISMIHDVYKLKEILKKYKDYKLDKYDEILKKLSDHYNARYHDNLLKYGTNGSSTDELNDIDKLWVEIKEKLPIPKENKYKTRFFSDLLEPNKYYKDEFWLKEHNKAIKSKIKKWKKEYIELQ